MARRDLPQTLTAEELDRLLAMPNMSTPTGLRDRCVLEVMVRCGLRVSEVCGLYLRDVDWRENKIRVRAEVAKGGREAIVYFDEPTRLLLERWKDTRRHYAAGRPHLFVAIRQATRGAPLTRRAIHKMVSRRAEKAGIEHPVWPHQLRHTFATGLLTEGFNIEEVRKLMRHSDIRTTAIYLEITDTQLAEKVRRRRAT